MLGPAYRMATNITDMHTVGIPAEALDYLGYDDDEDGEDEYEDD